MAGEEVITSTGSTSSISLSLSERYSVKWLGLGLEMRGLCHTGCWGSVIKNPKEGKGVPWFVADIGVRGGKGRCCGVNGHSALNLTLRFLSINAPCLSFEVVAISEESHPLWVAA